MRRLAVLAGLVLGYFPGLALAGEVACRIENGVLVVPAIAAGVNGRFILDTGASPTVFNDLTANGLNLGKFGERGISGNEPASYVRQVHAACGGLPLKRVALSADMVGLSLGCRHWVDGLLGTDYFRGKTVTIDFRKHLLEIQEPQATGGLGPILNDVPFCDRNDAVFVTVQSPVAGRPLCFLLDTGASRTFIDLKLARQFGMPLSTQGRKVRTVEGSTVAYESGHFTGSCQGKALPSTIFAEDFSKILHGHLKHIDGIVGTDFLQAFRVHIDFQTRLVQLD